MAYIKDLTQIHSTNVPPEGGGQLTTSCEFPEEPLADPPLESTDKTEADSISQKVTLFLTKSFELLVDCGPASLHSGYTHFIPTEGKLCLWVALSGPGKECSVCLGCPEFPVRHPFQTTAWELARDRSPFWREERSIHSVLASAKASPAPSFLEGA